MKPEETAIFYTVKLTEEQFLENFSEGDCGARTLFRQGPFLFMLTELVPYGESIVVYFCTTEHKEPYLRREPNGRIHWSEDREWIDTKKVQRDFFHSYYKILDDVGGSLIARCLSEIQKTIDIPLPLKEFAR